MSTDAVERDVRRSAAQWAFIQHVETIDKTDFTVKLRLHVDTECFIQVYANTHKQLSSYTLVLNRSRVLGGRPGRNRGRTDGGCIEPRRDCL